MDSDHFLILAFGALFFFQAKLLGQMLYYMLTTGAGKQTLGEEYCDITQVQGVYVLPFLPRDKVS